MGIKGAAKLLWQASNVNSKTLDKLNIGKRLEVDGNALVWKLGRGKGLHTAVNNVALELNKLAFFCGFQLNVTFDGEERPDCKRDSFSRNKERELTRIQALFCRLKAIKLSNKLDNPDQNSRGTAVDEEKTKKELEEFNAEAARLDKKASDNNVSVTPDFIAMLKERLDGLGAFEVNGNGGYVRSEFIHAKFQADYIIAKRIIEGKGDLVYSTDTDFPALIGPKCILLKETKWVSRRKRKQDDPMEEATFVLGGGSNRKMKEL